MRTTSLALYVHIPFCQAKCPYCDFNSYAGLEAVMAPYVDALIAEMALWREATRDSRLTTVFFGGGTPSFLPLAETERVFAALRGSFRLTPLTRTRRGFSNRKLSRGVPDFIFPKLLRVQTGSSRWCRRVNPDSQTHFRTAGLGDRSVSPELRRL